MVGCEAEHPTILYALEERKMPRKQIAQQYRSIHSETRRRFAVLPVTLDDGQRIVFRSYLEKRYSSRGYVFKTECFSPDSFKLSE